MLNFYFLPIRTKKRVRVTILVVLMLSLFQIVNAQCILDVDIEVEPGLKNTYCTYDTITLRTGNFDSYQWFFTQSLPFMPEDTISNANDSIYQFIAGDFTFGYFSVEVVTDTCVEMAEPFLLDTWVFLPPVIQHEAKILICNGDSTKVSNAFIGLTDFQWLRDLVPIPGANRSEYWVKEPGEYILQASPIRCPEIILNSGTGPVFRFIGPEKPLIIQNQDTLNTTFNPLWDYQWLLNGDSILAANKHFIVPEQSGIYLVMVTGIGDCAAMSDPFDLTITPVLSVDGRAKISIFPTSLENWLNVEYSGDASGSLTIFDVLGRPVGNRKAINPGFNERIDVSGFATGWYLAVFVLEGRRYAYRVFKR